MSFLDAVGICEAMWVLCAWPAVYSSHTPRMYALKIVFRHTSRGWILLVQPPRISTCDMLFSLRTSSLRWTLNVSNTNKTCRPLVSLTRSFTDSGMHCVSLSFRSSLYDVGRPGLALFFPFLFRLFFLSMSCLSSPFHPWMVVRGVLKWHAASATEWVQTYFKISSFVASV